MYHVQGLTLEPTKIKFSTPCNSVCKNVLPTQRLHFISVSSSLIQEKNVFAVRSFAFTPNVSSTTPADLPNFSQDGMLRN